MANSSSNQKDYDPLFFEYSAKLSRDAALAIIPIIKKLLPDISSAIDFGCSEGIWLKHWVEHGVHDIKGVDGQYGG